MPPLGRAYPTLSVYGPSGVGCQASGDVQSKRRASIGCTDAARLAVTDAEASRSRPHQAPTLLAERHAFDVGRGDGKLLPVVIEKRLVGRVQA